MKKFFMIAVMAVAALTASAQQEPGSWSINPQFGLGYGTISDAGDISGGMQSSLGADAKYQVNDQFGVSAGINFRYWESDEVDHVKFKLSFFEIPVLAHYNFSEHLSAFAGAKFNFISEAKRSTDKVDLDFKDNCNSTTISIPVGLRYTFNSPWNIAAYYEIPTQKINKEGSVNNKIGGVMVTVGYRFDL